MSTDASQQAAERYFVPDRALERLDTLTDTFEFEAVAATIIKLIESAEPPLSIALLGPWGSGKTTLLNDVIAQLRAEAKNQAARSGLQKVGEALRLMQSQPRDVVVYLDAWKYESDSLRRQLLLAVEAQLKVDGLLDSRSSVASRLYQETGRIEQEPPQLRWRQAPAALGLLVIVWLALASLTVFGDAFAQRVAALLLQLATAVTLYLLFTGQELFRRITTSAREMPLVSPEQFESEFRSFVAHAGVRRLVLVLDNIDRMTPDASINALSTLKTFLEPSSDKGVYVVPIDDSALRAHLRRRFRGDEGETDAEGEGDLFAREYLRKFFGATIRVPPSSTRELVDFTSQQVSRVKPLKALAPAAQLRVAQVLARVPGTTPRRIKRHVNALSARLAILDARSERLEFRAAEATLAPTLAMLTVVEEEWPDTFTLLEQHPWVLRLWQGEIAGTPVRIQADDAGRLERMSDEAISFIKSVLPTLPLSSLRMLFRLKLDVSESRVDDYEAFIDELEQGQHEQIIRRIDGLSLSERRAHLDVALERMRDRVERLHFDFANSIAIAVLEGASAWGEDLEVEVASAVAEEYATRQALRSRLLEGPSTQASVWLVARSSGHDRTLLIDYLASRISRPSGSVVVGGDDPELQYPDAHWQLVLAVVQAMAQKSHRFVAAELEPVRAALVSYPARKSDLAFLWQDPDLASKFIETRYLSKRMQAAFAELTVAAPEPSLELLDAVFALNGDPSRDVVYKELVDLIGAWLGGADPKAQIAESVRALQISAWPLDRLGRDLITRLAVLLDEAWGRSTEPKTEDALFGLLLQLRRFSDESAERDAGYLKWLPGLPMTRLAAFARDLADEDRVLGAPLILAAVQSRAALPITAVAERVELMSLGWTLSEAIGPESELETAAAWLRLDPNTLVANSARLIEAMALAPSGAERLETLLLDALDQEQMPEGAVSFLSSLESLHGNNAETLRLLIQSQLQRRSKRVGGELLLEKLSNLLGVTARTQIWGRFVEDTRSQLQASLREGTEWSTAQEEVDLLRRHRDELPEGSRAELASVLRAGVESVSETVRTVAIAWAIQLTPERAGDVRDAFAQRLPPNASKAETEALVAAADALGASDAVLWKLGEVATSESEGAPTAQQARSRFLPPAPENGLA